MRKTLVILTLLAASPGAVYAQSSAYPDHPIRIIVATPAGSTPDVGARLLNKFLTQDLGQAVVIENRPGANGLIAAREALKGGTDGYTLLIAPQSTMSLLPRVSPKDAGFILTDFVGVGQLFKTDFSLIVRTGTGLNSVADVIAAARKSPGKLVGAITAPGSAGQAALELFKQTAGINIYTVPFNTSPAAAIGVAAGNADMLFETIASTQSVVASGKARRIAMTGATRFPLAPTIPTMAESGVPGYAVTTWAGLFAPKGVPADRVQRVSASMAKAFKDPSFVQALAASGFLPGEADSTRFQDFWQKESEVWAKTVASAPAMRQNN